MDSINSWLPLGIAAIAVLIALLAYFQKRDPNEPVTLEGVVEDTMEVVSDAMIFAEEMTPVATTIVAGVRQKYLNGDLNFDELKPEAMKAMRLLFPEADEGLLDKAVEAAIFFAKLTAGPLWHKKPAEVSSTDETKFPLYDQSGVLLKVVSAGSPPTTGNVTP